MARFSLGGAIRLAPRLGLWALFATLFAAAGAGGPLGCAADKPATLTPPPQPLRSPDLARDQVALWMAGTFSSADQAASDPEYRDIILHMSLIWRDRADGRWFYVEQALAATPDQPYRQRIYRLTGYGGLAKDRFLMRSDVFTLPGDPAAFVGAWQDASKLAGLAPEQLTVRDGCALILDEQPDGSYRGSTLGRGCPSELRGASYATSEAAVFPDRLISWDRGFDDKGAQVWGATKGGYVFKKLTR